jgi:hypothetical protein
MIRNRAEAMSRGGCHQNSNNKEIVPNIHWPNSAGFVHVTEEGELSNALTKLFLPARSSLLENYLQEACGPACQLVATSPFGTVVSPCLSLPQHSTLPSNFKTHWYTSPPTEH